MFRFWSQDSRASKTVPGDTLAAAPRPIESVLGEIPPHCLVTPTLPASSPSLGKRRLDLAESLTPIVPPAKRQRSNQNDQLPSPTSASADPSACPSADECEDLDMLCAQPSAPLPKAAVNLDSAREVIEQQFGLEILLKHDELRLINQELGRCQVALEQLRRCHLIPFPLNCPTPEQMLDISGGTGPARQSRPGHNVPQWAPPFGVVDGPYARHYAKWLIPDPKFDGVGPSFHSSIVRNPKVVAAEGRTTRNSSDLGTTGKRPARGLTGQKLQALSSGYPQPKDKQSPCVLKRSDGQMVKLICIDCKRWDFSSTQGFINHCRIAHRRDFKSHEEAAVHCGHPIDDDAGGAISDDHKPASCTSPSSGLVHPFARSESITNQQAYTALRSRIGDSLALYKAGQHPRVKSIPTAAPSHTRRRSKVSSTFVGSPEVPHLSRWMLEKNLKADLGQEVRDAKTKLEDDEDGMVASDEEWEDSEPAAAPILQNLSTTVARVPVVSSVTNPGTGLSQPEQPSSSIKNRTLPPQLGFARLPSRSSPVLGPDQVETPMYDDDMVIELSPNTMASNNAPSLVSDDGEYDDSDDGSSSETSESMDAEQESDIAEINIDEDEIATPAPLRPGSTAVRFKKAESKHVTFVTPHIASQPKGRRSQTNALDKENHRP